MMAWVWFVVFAVSCTANICLYIELKRSRADVEEWKNSVSILEEELEGKRVRLEKIETALNYDR